MPNFEINYEVVSVTGRAGAGMCREFQKQRFFTISGLIKTEDITFIISLVQRNSGSFWRLGIIPTFFLNN